MVNFLTVGSFLLYESQFEYGATTKEVITTETTDNSVITQEVNGENSEVNNVEGDMYRDNSTHNE